MINPLTTVAPLLVFFFFLYLGDPPSEVQCPEVLTTENGNNRNGDRPGEGAPPKRGRHTKFVGESNPASLTETKNLKRETF